MAIAIAVESVTFFFRRLESKLVFILLLYQFIDSIELLQPPPPPTTRPPRICAGLGVSIKSAPWEGGGSSPWCGWLFHQLCRCVGTSSYVNKLRGGSFVVPARTQIAVKL